jgi:hypothetical protein
MSTRNDFDLLLSEWFEATAPSRPPELLLSAVLERTAHTRRRPAWRVIDHWLSPAASIRLATVRRTAVVVAVGLIAAMIIVGFASPVPSIGGPPRSAPPDPVSWPSFPVARSSSPTRTGLQGKR